MERRVQLPAWSDRWMMGDRFGVLVKVVKGVAHVKLDISGRIVRFMIDDLQVV